MRCEDCREAISARLDGEATPDEIVAIDAHLATCAGCGAFAAHATELHRTMRVRAADPVPDLTSAILAKVPAGAERPQRARTLVPEWPRYALLAIGLTQLVLAIPALLLGDSAGSSVHVARELGSWDVALGVGLLVAAWQPRRASGLLPMTVALAGAMIVTAALDVAAGRAPVVGEAHHVLDLLGVLALWLLSRQGEPVRRGSLRTA